VRGPLTEDEKENTGNAGGLDTEPNTAGRKRNKRENQFPKINLKY